MGLLFTTKDVGKGTGQGLALVHATIQNHSGTIQISSPHDAGAPSPPACRYAHQVTPRPYMLGGTLDAGSGPGGGFRVRARLPLEELSVVVGNEGRAQFWCPLAATRSADPCPAAGQP